MVDAAGGIEFDVPVRMLYNDPYQNLSIDLQPGRQVLDGEKAEMLMRYRKGYQEGDLSRIGVQQAFLEAALEQKSDMKISAAEVYRLLSKEMETDLDMKTARTLISLLQKSGEKEEGINFIELPVVVSADNLWTLAFAPEAADIIKNYF
jgi:anionic cell wall polymer biosynthesis LytR-Cps2A-Psr (LCP) family protein